MKVSPLSIAIAAAVLAISVTAVIGLNSRSNAEASGIIDTKLLLPPNYETLRAVEKEAILFQEMEASRFQELPPLSSVNPIKFISSHLMLKLTDQSDEAPVGYEKAIHAHGVAAKVLFEAEADAPYTGLFKGVDHGIIRMSVTGDPKGKDFAPGVALKFLIDGHPSENVSALYKLSGQKDNHNFFAHELSNIIPIQFDPKSLFSSAVFGRVTSNPTKVSVQALATIDQSGQAVQDPLAPVQIYLVPQHGNDFASTAHDFREDFLKLPAGIVLYEVFATREEGRNLATIDEARRAKAVRIGRLVSSSTFIASAFGDRRLFFRHHRFEDH